MLTHAFTSSHLDYCNVLLSGLPKESINNLHLLQNSATHVLTRTRGWVHITPVLKSVYWVPVHFRIDFKVLILVFKCLNSLGPSYLSDLLSISYQSLWRVLWHLTLTFFCGSISVFCASCLEIELRRGRKWTAKCCRKKSEKKFEDIVLDFHPSDRVQHSPPLSPPQKINSQATAPIIGFEFDVDDHEKLYAYTVA